MTPQVPALLKDWLAAADPAHFPYTAVVEELQRTGKHFADHAVLDALAEARVAAQGCAGAAGEHLVAFLDVTLDKRDRRYSYATYIALSLLDLPSGARPARCQRRYDTTTADLLTDLLAFELGALDGAAVPLPRMRPDARTVARRCRPVRRVLTPVLTRLRVELPDHEDPVAWARAAVAAGSSARRRRSMRHSMLPVAPIHDEYLFIRVLQAFETFFALAGVYLSAGIRRLRSGDVAGAVRYLDLATNGFQETAPLFSLLATMRVEAFRTFRRFTEGASAIQSAGYKTMEALCREPDRQRLASIAYDSVPGVRVRASAAGWPTVDGALRAALAAGRLGARERADMAAARSRFARAYRRWRQTHYRLAARMLGDAPGSGYTSGVPYLASVIDIPVFDEPGRASGKVPTCADGQGPGQ